MVPELVVPLEPGSDTAGEVAPGSGVDVASPPDGAVSPPPPTTAAPEPALAVDMVRHPTLDAPDQVVAGQEFTVSVALTEEQITPDVTVKAGPESSVTPEGALAFSLPAASEEWPIDIDLLAAGFDLTDGGVWSRRVTLYKVGDSDFARFTLKSRAMPGRFEAAPADRPALSRRALPRLGVASGHRVPRPDRNGRRCGSRRRSERPHHGCRRAGRTATKRWPPASASATRPRTFLIST